MANPNPDQSGMINFRDRTPEERREFGRKGAEKTNKLLKERKTMREMLDYLLAKETTTEQGEVVTNLEAIMVATINEAKDGNVKATTLIRDTIGEKPADVVQFKPTVDSLKDIEDLVDGK